MNHNDMWLSIYETARNDLDKQTMKEEINKLPNSDSKKKAYQTPQILSKETLEVLAALCTPSPPAKADGASCPGGPFNS